MFRFLVFGGDVYYPSGGWEDYRGAHESEGEAVAFAKGFVAGESLRWAHVYDRTLDTIIWRDRS